MILTIATAVMTNSTDLERSKLKVVVLFEEMEQVEDNTCVAAIDHQEQVMLIQHTKLTENKKYNSVTACRITLKLQQVTNIWGKVIVYVREWLMIDYIINEWLI